MMTAFLWLLVHGAAKLRSPYEQMTLDDEQAHILAEIRKRTV